MVIKVMLYKKIHRQYLREFWKGRKFKYYPGTIIIKLYIKDGGIWLNRSYDGDVLLISLHNPFKGIIGYKDAFKWLE